MNRPQLATPAQVAEYLQVSTRTLDDWAYRGVGPRYARVGRHRRYDWRSVEMWLDRNQGGGSDAA